MLNETKILSMFFRRLISQADLTFPSLQRSSLIRTKVTNTYPPRSQILNCGDCFVSYDIFFFCLFWVFFKPELCFSVFLAREAELRRLRKANIEFEEQNAVLQRHIKDMYTAKERLEAELGMDEKKTQALHQHLLAIKQTLIASLSSVPLPGQLSVLKGQQMQMGI